MSRQTERPAGGSYFQGEILHNRSTLSSQIYIWFANVGPPVVTAPDQVAHLRLRG